jgi:hypothetical protein
MEILDDDCITSEGFETLKVEVAVILTIQRKNLGGLGDIEVEEAASLFLSALTIHSSKKEAWDSWFYAQGNKIERVY